MRFEILGVERRRFWHGDARHELVMSVGRYAQAFAGLAAHTQDVLYQKPANGVVFAFQGRVGNQIMRPYWSGQEICLYYIVLERRLFPWPNAKDGAVRMTSAPLAKLREGIDRRRPDCGIPPARAG